MKAKRGLDDTGVLLGALIGLVLGGCITLLRSSLSGRKRRQRLLEWSAALRGRLYAGDDLARSIRAGKVVAHQRAESANGRDTD